MMRKYTEVELIALAIKRVETLAEPTKEPLDFCNGCGSLVAQFNEAFGLLGFEIIKEGNSYFVIPKPAIREEEDRQEEDQQDYEEFDYGDNYPDPTFITNTGTKHAKLWVEVGKAIGHTIVIKPAFDREGIPLSDLVGIHFAEEPPESVVCPIRLAHDKYDELKDKKGDA